MPLLTRRRVALTLCAFGLFALAALIVSPLLGPVNIDFVKAIADWRATAPGEPLPNEMYILAQVRLPRIVLGFLAGAGLAVVGAVFQAMLRNPLATPYTLGIASGGSFGAAVGTMLPVVSFNFGPISHVQILAMAGSLFAMGLIYMLARSGGRVTPFELLLAGVTLSMIFSSMILAVRYFASPGMLVEIDRWLMGGLSINGWRDVWVTLPLLVPSLAVLFFLSRGLDQISFGEELAAGRGVNVARLQKQAFFFGSLAIAAIVSTAGPIGFVGLIVPHTARRMTGPDHRLLLPCCALAGGGFLVLCDTLARTAIENAELPVGVITSLLGGPFFIYLLIHGRRSGRLWGSEA